MEATGRNVVGFKAGDAVFGGKSGALGQYVAVRAARMALKPENVSFEQAAAVPIAGVTALQALRDKGLIKAGQKVLINGASGGVGTFAVQIAKAYGAEVTGVCSTRNLELVRSIGADHVIDYTAQDFTTQSQRYDLILDNVGNHSPLALKRVLAPTGRLVIVGGPSDDPWLGPITPMLKALAMAPFISQEIESIYASINHDDLALLADWMRQGKVTPVIDRRYPLDEAAAAVAYLETGRARGKVIVTVD